MENINNSELPRIYRGEEQRKGGKYQEYKQKGDKVQQPDGQEPPFLFGVGPVNTIPQIKDESNKKGNHVKQQGGQEPTLFGENQTKGGFGPVYAIPTVPWQGPPMVVDEAILEEELEKQQRQAPPVLFDQGQFKGDFGQVNTVPTVPRQQWDSHPQTMIPCCNCYQIGYRYHR